jgi:ATP-dependent RNA/DNA helicase IGHMBP2
VQLDTQFRMVSELVEFSNEQFYDDSIETSTSHEASPSQLIGLINLDVNRGERSLDTSKQNQLETTAAAGQVRSLIDRHYEPDEIRVIAAYSAQEELIRWQLENLPGDDTDQVQVATIDRFQGNGKKAIGVSFTRSNQQGNVGSFPVTMDQTA